MFVVSIVDQQYIDKEPFVQTYEVQQDAVNAFEALISVAVETRGLTLDEPLVEGATVFIAARDSAGTPSLSFLLNEI